MNSLIKVALLFFILVNQAHALMPENGWWWNPNASGSGYNIEIQDNVIAVSAYVFDDAGAPIYYISAGPMTSDRSYTGSLDLVTGGQCINCPYRQPSRSSVGTVKVDFTSSGTGYIAFNNGVSIPIQRLGYTIDTTSVHGLLGEWVLYLRGPKSPFASSSNIDFFEHAEKIEFTKINVSNTFDAKPIALGSKSGDTLNTASAVKNGDTYRITLSHTISSNYIFDFSFSGINAIEGVGWIVGKYEKPTGSGKSFIGFRN